MPRLKKGVSFAISGRTFKNEISDSDVVLIEKLGKRSITNSIEQPKKEKPAKEEPAPKEKAVK